MTLRADALLAASLIVQITLAIGLLATSTVGFLVSILGSILWLGSLVGGQANWSVLAQTELIPAAACVCLRNIGVLMSNWVEMEWRPLIEVLLISVAAVALATAINLRGVIG